ncbi:MAG TPA: hypothetical protein VKH81_23020 [Candidatus Angelobacter sp.]|nr:hypothetical protein [Candidatus Angelobacter sp.]
MRRLHLCTALLLTLGCCHLATAAELKPKTTSAFDRYVAATEARFTGELRPGGNFLYIDGFSADQRSAAYTQLRQGEILVDKLETSGMSSDIPDGMVHHWVGIIFIPGVTLAQTLPVVKDYDRRAELYKPDVIASRTTSHHGDDFTMFLRLRQKKFTTVVFNTDYAVHWGQVSPNKVFSNSISTRIAEVKDPDKPEGEELPVGTGHGYLWRLNTYWRFEEKDGGVYLQCEALSLTRDMPTGLGWLLKPLVTAIPKASLNRALGQTRKVVQEEGRKCCNTAQSR